MTSTPEPAGPREWTPGAGWERVKREMPHIVPELTDADDANLDRLLADEPAAKSESVSKPRRAGRLRKWVRRAA
jgi:hypothetical protein